MTNNALTYEIVKDMDTPFGVTKKGKVCSFTVFVSGAKSCTLELFTEDKQTEQPVMDASVLMHPVNAGGIFHISVKLAAEEEITYRYRSDKQSFCDPYAKVLRGTECYGGDRENIRAVICEPMQKKPKTYVSHSFEDLILYKLHVRGFTANKNSGVRAPGTFLGVCEKIRDIKLLGMTGILLMPVMDFCETMPGNRINYWGYTKEGFFFAPKAAYAANPARAAQEFAEMITRFHAAGIDVYMEMMFPEDCRYDMLKDSLVYFATVYAVDGFRLYTGDDTMRRLLEEPYLRDIKLFGQSSGESIACGTGSTEMLRDQNRAKRYAVCSDAYLRDMRRYLKGDENQIGGFFHHMKYNAEAFARIHYIADNNGFTLSDVYRYDIKHNEENGENNKDGMDNNFSWNCGTEGETTSKKIQKRRLKMVKNALAVLFLSQSTPLLLAGDEFLQTQQGNNNAYCQDNALTYLDWSLKKKNRALVSYVQKLIALRRQMPVLHGKEPLRGMDYAYQGIPDISFHGIYPWRPDESFYSRTGGILLCGKYDKVSGNSGDIYILSNMHWEAHTFFLPLVGGQSWKLCFATDNTQMISDGPEVSLPPRTIAVFIQADNQM